MNKKRLLSMSAASLIAVSMLSACTQSGGGGGDTTTTAPPATTTAPPSTMAEAQQSQAQEIEVKEFELENKKIQFLSSWSRNPANGKNKDVALELFQTRYGGEVEDILTTQSERFNRLATLVSTGNSPDFFSAADMDAFPKGAINHMFKPIDDIIDFTDEWWSPVKDINDQFLFQGKHYVGVISPEVDVLMIYNKAVVAENGLKDPADLMAEGKWDWNTCKDMMNEFCSKSEENYATDGWWVVKGFSGTTGVPYIGIEDGKVTNNLRDPLIEEAQEFVYNIRREDMAYPVWDYGWVANPGNVGLGKTLFFPCGYWALTELGGEYSLDKYGNVEDVGFVPMPKCPSADELYIPARINGYMLASGAPNPEGFACYMYCEIAASGSEEAENITREQYFNEYGWTEDMWEMRNTIFKLLREHPTFDFFTGISDMMTDALDNPSKESYHQNNVSWIQTREEQFNTVQDEVDTANKSLEE